MNSSLARNAQISATHAHQAYLVTDVARGVSWTKNWASAKKQIVKPRMTRMTRKTIKTKKIIRTMKNKKVL